MPACWLRCPSPGYLVESASRRRLKELAGTGLVWRGEEGLMSEEGRLDRGEVLLRTGS